MKSLEIQTQQMQIYLNVQEGMPLSNEMVFQNTAKS